MTTISTGAVQRVPPHNLEAEESVLGAMLLSESSISVVLERLRADDFYKPAHRKIFESLVSLFGRGEAVDSVTAAEELRRMGSLEEVGGKAYLFHLVSSVPAASNAGFYARIVEETALLRRLIEASQEAAAMAYDSGDDVDQIVDQIEGLIFGVAQRRLGDRFAHIRDLLHEHLEQVEALQLRGSHVTGVPTGFVDIDKLTSGLQGSNLIIVAARPSFGKCLSGDAQIVVRDGSTCTIEELVRARQATLLTLGDDYRLWWTQPVGFVDDGVRQTYRVTTRLGRTVTATASHPFLTIDGWKALAELDVGAHVAVPRSLPVFGSQPIGERRAKLLGYLIGDGGLRSTSPVFTQTNERVLRDFEDAVHAFEGIAVRRIKAADRAPGVRVVASVRGRQNPVTDWLRDIGLMGCRAAEKFVPDVIFTAPRDEVALFLNRLFATDGWACVSSARQIGYSSVSERLARQIQHLLLRFGVIARLRPRLVSYRGSTRRSWQLEIIDAASILTFIEDIGIFGKETALASVERVLRGVERKAVNDVIPRGGWPLVDAARNGRSWLSIGAELGLGRQGARPHEIGINLHVGSRPISRSRMRGFAEVLGDPTLGHLATSDVYWDRIDSIEPFGRQRVYDLTVPETHNFIANDICVHNTSFALNIAQYAATEHQLPVAIFSLEMSKMELVQRLVCAEALVDVHKLRTGNLTDQDWGRLGQAVGRLADAPIYIDDTEAVTVLEIRAKARRLKQKSGLELVIVDYLQLMSGPRRSENRQQEISEISRSLKILARELRVPVIAVSQLSRAVEQRQDKRPVLADLRECVTGDTLVCLADGRRARISDLVGSKPDVLAMSPGGRIVVAQSEIVWRVGRRPVFEVLLASGRTVRATGRHRLYGADGWVRVGDLRTGDRLALARHLPEPRACEPWPDGRIVLLGHLVGDGSYLAGQPLRYTTSSEENSQAVAEAAATEFGSAVGRYEGPGSWHQLVLSGNGNRWHPRGVNAWLRELGIFGQRSFEKRLPEAVFRLPNHQIAGLLRHLWATDGTISPRTTGRGSHGVFYATSSETLAADVAALLLRLGIVARIDRSRKGEYRPTIHVRVSGGSDQQRFLDLVGAFGPRTPGADALRRALEQSARGTNVGTLPAQAFGLVRSAMRERGVSTRQMAELRGVSYGGTSQFGFAPSRSLLLGYADLLDDQKLRDVAQSDLFWDRVVSVTPAGDADVFDLTVPGPASWLADGIVSHNSGAIEQDADLVMFIYRDEVYHPDSTDKGTAEVLLAKHRNGPVGKATLTFLENYTKFANFSPR